MQQSNRNKFNRYGSGVIKLLIAVVAFIFIYKEVIRKEDFSSVVNEYRNILSIPESKPEFVFVFVLMFANWSLEAVKWKWMMRRLEVISFPRSLAAIFSGLTVSFFTPNRIGEYAGRVFHLRTADRIKATLITILENLSQLIITVLVGCISLIFYLNEYVELHEYILWVIGVLMIIFSGVLLLLFFEVPLLDASILKIKRLSRFRKYLEILSGYRKSELFVLLNLALLRYIVFTLQFFLLLKIFGIESTIGTSVLLINMIFFVMTLVPTFALSELGVRGAVATYFLSKISSDSLAILNASVSLWIINLVIPALIGIVFIFQFRFNREIPS